LNERIVAIPDGFDLDVIVYRAVKMKMDDWGGVKTLKERIAESDPNNIPDKIRSRYLARYQN
jgi:hypothetical protein